MSKIKSNITTDLPKGWMDYKFGEVVTLINGRAYGKDELLSHGKYKVIRIQNLNGGENWYYSNLELENNKYCKKGDLLFAWSTTFGPYFWGKEKAIFHYHIWNLILGEKIDKQFTYYYLLEITEELKKSSHGVAMLHITKGMMEDWKFPLPPLPEQQRIVQQLDALFLRIDKAIQLTNENLAHCQHLLPAALNKVFEEAKEKGWEIKSIEKVFKIKSGEFMSAKMMTENAAFDVYGGNGINGKHTEHNVEGENIIIGRVGAKCGNVRFVKGKAWITDNAFFLSEYYEKASKEYLAMVLENLELGKTANQAAQPVISYKGIKDLLIPLPDLPTQQRIVIYLNQLSSKQQQLLQQYSKQLQQLQALKSSLLDAAFKGEL